LVQLEIEEILALLVQLEELVRPDKLELLVLEDILDSKVILVQLVLD
jgi:hypothetical protein